MKTTLIACAAALPVVLIGGVISDGVARIALRAVRPDIPQPDGWSFYLIILAIWAITSALMIWATKQGFFK